MSWIFGSCPGPSTAWQQLSDAIVAAATGTSVKTAAVSNGGTGGTYAVGDFLTLAGGTGTVAAQVEVLTLSGSQVATVRIHNAGVYTAAPSSPAATTGGGGTGCTITITTDTNGWVALRDDTDGGGEKEVILQGEGSGSDEIFVGWRTYSSPANDRYNLELHGMAGYSAGVPINEQPSVSPGKYDGGTGALEAGCYLVCTNTSCNYWISVLPSRIVVVCQVGGNFFNAYLGWGDRYATAAEYPYPLCVAGSSSDANANHSQSIRMSGLVDPWRYNGVAFGPMGVMFVDNAWYGVQNSNISTANAGTATPGDRVVLPCGLPDREDSSVADEDRFVGEITGVFTEFIPNAGIISAVASMQRTPGTVDALVMLPATVVFVQPSHQVVMELTGVFWCSGFGGVQGGDRTIENGVVYRIFPNCNRSEIHGFVAIEEA